MMMTAYLVQLILSYLVTLRSILILSVRILLSSNWFLMKGLCPHFSDVASRQNYLKLRNAVAKSAPSSTESSVPHSAVGTVCHKWECRVCQSFDSWDVCDLTAVLMRIWSSEMRPFSLGKPLVTLQKIVAPTSPRVKMSS